jgi:uncharacterized protein (UPF0276 family)
MRRELSKDIIANMDGPLKDIECLEFIAEDYYPCSRTDSRVRCLAVLAKMVPLSLHGVTFGLASALPIELRRADGMARLWETVRPAFWSEHLSFVRAGGAEIGHLAAPPRSEAVVEGALSNIDALATHVGMKPLLENVASLIAPPCSTMSETRWLSAIVDGADASMLLDLHNLYANAKNSGLDPLQMLEELPLHRVRQIHLSGGVDILAPAGGTRLLDDHVHDVPDQVFDLLEVVARTAANPLMVIIERDGRYPDFEELLFQVRQAKTAISRGRTLRAADLNQSGMANRVEPDRSLASSAAGA